MAKIRVVIADDHQLMAVRIRQVLGEEFKVLDSVQDGRQAVDVVLRMDPDILVLDVSMPVLDGFEAAQQLRRAKCRTKIIFLSIHEDPDFIAAASAVGASGYVIKRLLYTDLVPAIREALGGQYCLASMQS